MSSHAPGDIAKALAKALPLQREKKGTRLYATRTTHGPSFSKRASDAGTNPPADDAGVRRIHGGFVKSSHD